MKVIGLDGITQEDLERELSNGARFVMFRYCISPLIVTLVQPTNIYFIPAGHGTLGRSWPYTLISAFLGWWGFPWGLIRTPQVILSNLSGGIDVTEQLCKGPT